MPRSLKIGCRSKVRNSDYKCTMLISFSYTSSDKMISNTRYIVGDIFHDFAISTGEIMSYQDFERALALAQLRILHNSRRRTLEQIQKRKNARYKLSPQLLGFYKSLDIYPSLAMKYLGSILIAPRHPENNSVAYALHERKLWTPKGMDRSTTMMTAMTFLDYGFER